MKYGVLILNLSPEECFQLFDWKNIDLIQISLENQLENITPEIIGLLSDKCKDNSKKIAFHAPSADIFLGSRNVGIKRESIKQINETIKLIGSYSEFITIHTGFTPRFSDLCDFERCLNSLNSLLKSAKKYRTFLSVENVHEETINQLLNYFNVDINSYLKLTLDIAHLLLYSNIKINVALKILSSKIIDIHLSTPENDRDAHRPISKNWIVTKELCKTLRQIDYTGSITIESLNLNDAKRSLKILEKELNL